MAPFHLNRSQYKIQFVSAWGISCVAKVPWELANVIARLLPITREKSQQIDNLPDEKSKMSCTSSGRKAGKTWELKAGQPSHSPWEVYRASPPWKSYPGTGRRRRLEKSGWMVLNRQCWFTLGSWCLINLIALRWLAWWMRENRRCYGLWF